MFAQSLSPSCPGPIASSIVESQSLADVIVLLQQQITRLQRSTRVTGLQYVSSGGEGYVYSFQLDGSPARYMIKSCTHAASCRDELAAWSVLGDDGSPEALALR